MDNRGEQWKSIWDKKGLAPQAPLHHVDGFDLLTEDEWDAMVSQVTRPLNFKKNDSILECGCGAGAFLASLTRLHSGLEITGVDYSESLLTIARQHLKGQFHFGDMTHMAFLSDNTFEHTLSFSTFHYLSSEEAAGKAVSEMVRVTKPGGKIYLGEVSDKEKYALAKEIRKVSHQAHKKVSSQDLDHLFLYKSFFNQLAEEMNLTLAIIDHVDFNFGAYQAAQYRYSVYLTKNKVAL